MPNQRSKRRSDRELFDAWADGDTNAGNLLFERYYPKIYKFFQSKINTGVEDLVQKTFEGLVKARHRFRGDAKVQTYLFQIARNQLAKAYRTKSNTPDLDTGITSLNDLGPSLSTQIAAKADYRLLLEALRRLPIDDQIILELYHFEGMSGPQVAAVLGLGIPAVRGRIRRATARLEALAAELPSTPGELLSTKTTLATWSASIRDQVDGADDS
ncbi:MAG: RNA polymerase sigma factor [Nannocystaceae bacterium]